MKAKPGSVSGRDRGGQLERPQRDRGDRARRRRKYKHVTYDGGNPAVVATVAGETRSTTQLTAEQTEMIRGKKCAPLAVVGDKPLELDGYGTSRR